MLLSLFNNICYLHSSDLMNEEAVIIKGFEVSSEKHKLHHSRIGALTSLIG